MATVDANTSISEAKQTQTKKRRKWVPGDNFWGYFFIMPAIIGLLLFKLFPIVAGLGISFTDWQTLTEAPTFVGLDNYSALVNDPFPWPFLKTLSNTLFFVLTVPLGMFIALGLALLVNQKIKGITIFRATYFLPLVTAVPAIALVWQALYQPRFGLLNYLLSFIGVDGPNWLGDPSWFKPSITLFSIWHGVGWGMMIFLAALQGINQEYYDAASVDGATRWDKFRKVTFPLISPQVFFVTVMLVITSFNSFAAVYVFGGGSGGGPLGSGATVVLYLYAKAFGSGEFGVGAAAAYVLALIVMVITLFQFIAQRKWVFYEE
jgi:multiple sugar transport system permease protein